VSKLSQLNNEMLRTRRTQDIHYITVLKRYCKIRKATYWKTKLSWSDELVTIIYN